MDDQQLGKLERISGGSATRAQVCVECGKEYEAKIIFITVNPIDLSKGYCYVCREGVEAERIKGDEVIRQIGVSKKRTLWRDNSGIPLKFMNQDFSSFDTKRPGNLKTIYDVCLKYADSFPIDYQKYYKKKRKPFPSLILQSSVAGLGKTHLAAAICHRILDRWDGEDLACPVVFTTESELLGKIQGTFNYSAEEQRVRESLEDIMTPLMYRSLLVLDEVGYERRTDLKFVRRMLFRLINGRYNNDRPIIITTNLSTGQLRAYLDAVDSGVTDSAERTFDRLWEMGRGKVYKLTGESYRRR